MIKKHPFYEGTITVSTGINDKVVITEVDLLNPPAVLSFSATLTAGSYFVSKLCEAATTAINAESGIQNQYLIQLDRNTGKVSVSVVSGSADYRISTLQGSDCIFSGDDEDDFGDTLYDGLKGKQSLGFAFGVRVLQSPTTPFVSEYQSSGVWCPSWPPSNDGQDDLEQTVIESVDIFGNANVYSFSDFILDRDIAKTKGYFGGFWATRTQLYEMLTLEEMDHFYFWFWGEFARDGSLFAYFEEYNDETPRPYALTGESLRFNRLGERPFGVRIFNHKITMRPKEKPEGWDALWVVES